MVLAAAIRQRVRAAGFASSSSVRLTKKLSPETFRRFTKRRERRLNQMLRQPFCQIAAPRVVKNILHRNTS